MAIRILCLIIPILSYLYQRYPKKLILLKNLHVDLRALAYVLELVVRVVLLRAVRVAQIHAQQPVVRNVVMRVVVDVVMRVESIVRTIVPVNVKRNVQVV